MKKSSLLMLLVLPLLVGGCSRRAKEKENKPPFEVPVVDLSTLHVTLPEMPTWDKTSAVKNDGTYDIIDIYEVSDMHAMIDFDTRTDHEYFGFSGLANYFSEKRADNKGTIVVSSGDMWQGGSESNLTRGKVVAECMRYVGFEAMCLGNHEFDWGEEILQQNAGYYKDDMPLMCGNLIDKRTNAMPTYLVPSTIIERGGYKIGVIGTMGSIEYSIAKAAFENFMLSSSATFAKTEAARLKNEEHCDAVIWLSHENAKNLAIPENIDAMFGGHEHDDVDEEVTEGANVTSVGHSIPRLATKNYGQTIAHAQLKFNPSTKAVAEASKELILAKNSFSYMKDETNIKNLIDQYKEATKAVKSYELNKISGDFRKDKELANLSCLAMYEAYKDETTVCALQNGDGGVRTDFSTGMITYGDVYTAFPFDNEIVSFKVKGSKIEDFFDRTGVRSCNKYVSKTKLSDYDTSVEYTIITTDYVCTNILKMYENEFTRFPSTVIRDTVAEYIYSHSGLNASNFSEKKPNYNAPTAM